MLGGLVYDNLDNIHRIIENEIADNETRWTLNKQVDDVAEDLKFYYY